MEQFDQVVLDGDSLTARGSDEPTTWIQRLPDEKFSLNCLWTSCYAVFEKLEELVHHLRSHITSITVYSRYLDHYQGSASDILCPISRCSTSVATITHLFRHLYMHIFHIRRQYMGLHVIFSRKDVVDISHCGFRSSMELTYDGSVLSCAWSNCSTVWDDVDVFCTHVNDHVNALGVVDRDSRLQLTCYWRGCGVCFKNKANLRVHCRHHSGDKTAACPYCGVFFSNNSKLIDHMLRKNQFGAENGDSENVFFCNLCQKRFGTQRLLREHCRRHIMNHKCEYCWVTVDSPSALQRHIAAVHAKRRLYACSFCGHSFSQKADLDRHILVHSTEFEHKCEYCGAQFRWKKQLTAHCRKHDTVYRPYTHLCHLCDAKYKHGYGLSRHLIQKHSCTIPRGFTRFQYKKCKDGYARLQTKRCLSKALALDLGYDSENKEHVS